MAEATPTVAVIIPAYNEEAVIARRLENLLALDYPRERLELVVTSDASSDRTHEIVDGFEGVKLIRNPRGGKVAAQDRAVRETEAEIVAFSDANATWAPDALRKLVRAFADPDVAYAAGRLVLTAADGGNREGAYWRYEVWLREQESRLGSITGGNGSIYAVRRADYVEVDPRFGHDLSFPYLMVQHGRRAVYDGEAQAFEVPTPTNEAEYRRKVRMFEHCWLITLRGRMLRRLPPRLLARGLLAPPPALRERRPPPRAAGDVDRARRRGARLPGRARGAAASARGRGDRRRDRALLRADHVGDGAGALELSAPRRAGDVGGGGGNARVNRAFDVATSAAGLVVASPVLAAAALAIKLEDRGPVLYRQTRVGRDGQDFELLKLRTMVVGAEKLGAGFAVNQGDARITRVGRVLRKLSLDELPQLWNVLRGDMSLIGPRPTLRYQVEQYTDRQRRRLEIKPGLTGWAQIHGRARLPWDERIELDVWYVDHRSPRLDLKILLRTPVALFSGTYKGETGGWQGGGSA